jgi:diaminopimelate epimerase
VSHYFKYHALGNDYIVIDPNKLDICLTKENIKLICHRNYGVGSDGILYGPFFKDNEIFLKIFNPDGSEAEKSGNGIRIFSRYLRDSQYVTGQSTCLNTLGGSVEVEYLDDLGDRIKVNMGKTTFLSSMIPVSGEEREVINEELRINNKLYHVTCLSIGNPHCVIPLENISQVMAIKLGPLVENHDLFPNRINLQLLEIIDRKNIKIEIWERGAGYTLASGSSSCSAARAAYKLGLIDNQVNVHMPGGVIEICIDGDGYVYMTGEVNSICSGDFSNAFMDQNFILI